MKLIPTLAAFVIAAGASASDIFVQASVQESHLHFDSVSPAVWADIDGDGDWDHVRAEWRMMVYQNTAGTGGWSMTTGSTPTFDGAEGLPCWGDINGDGYLDFAMSGCTNGYIYDSGYVAIYRSQGGTNFVNAGITNLHGMHEGCTRFCDFNNDGYDDIFVAGKTTNPPLYRLSRLYRNDGGTNFTPLPCGIIDLNDCDADFADFDGDGWKDLIVIGYSWSVDNSVMYLYKNYGGTNFVRVTGGQKAKFEGFQMGQVRWGDFDADGDPDLAVCGYGWARYYKDTHSADKTAVYRNDGDGVFTEVVAAFPKVEYGSVAWGDYDKDGRLDLAVAGRDNYVDDGRGGIAGTNYARVFRNTGSGFEEATLNMVLKPVSECNVQWFDFDGNGWLDLMVSGKGADYKKSNVVYLNICGSDSDGDGMSNLGESVAGTSWTNASDVLSVSAVSNSASGLVLQWPSVAGKMYDVMRSSNLVDWAAAETNISATAPLNTWSDGQNAPLCFYRIVVH